MATSTILLIEDNAFDAKVFRLAVQDAGIGVKVQVARDGIEAIAILERGLIDLDPIVVTDLKMPRMNGIELLQTIRRTVEFAHLTVFVVTTSNLPSDRDEALTLGIEGYIQKTGDERDLIDPIISYLQRQGDLCP